HIAENLNGKLRHSAQASTLHAVGLRTLRQMIPVPEVNPFKYGNIIESLLPRFEADVGPEEWGRVLRIVEFARLTLTRPDDAAQRALALKLSGGRTTGVGDLRQAIMGWAGADVRSWQAFAEATDATELPLSICYRCPVSHLEMAQEIVPEIEAAPGAKIGTLQEASQGWAFSRAGRGDLILCRRTAPLLRGCL